jgi:phosphoglycolate phosphatase
LKKINIYFDFDGTLFDSYKGISLAVNKASLEVYLIDFTLPKEMVGPPISLMHDSIFPNYNKKEDFVRSFREYYDNQYFFESVPYYHDVNFFKSLLSLNCTLNIVSNKPTQLIEKILEKFQITHFFNLISGSTDLLIKKKERLLDLVRVQDINDINIVVGDTAEDYEMSKYANSSFIFARYGYGVIDENVDCIDELNSLIKLIKNKHDKTI